MFLLIVLSIFFGMNYFAYSRVANGLTFSGNFRRALQISMLAFTLLFILGEVLSRRTDFFLAKAVLGAGSIWVGLVVMAFTFLVLADIGRLFLHSPLQRYWLTISALILLVLTGSYSIYNVARFPRLKTIHIKVDELRLPKSVPSFTIVQLSDLHLHKLRSKAWLEGIVEETNRQNPDLIVITGDLVDSDICKPPLGRASPSGGGTDFCSVLRRLRAKYGVFAVTGNHDFYAGIDTFMNAAKESGITVLRNNNVKLNDFIQLVGVDDNTGKSFGESGCDLASALKTPNVIGKGKLVILLSHQPDIFDEAIKNGVNLQLSGHTHAGQIPPVDILVQLNFKYPCGFYTVNSSHLYTTSGTGFWGPPMRLFSRCEIVKIVIEH
ncbi:MAG: metallophosphoesterase [Planctomycetes bacterium]|nr:metallophosphoesterase [Planctomycetota bacterium]